MAALGASQLLEEDLENRCLPRAGAAGQDAQPPGEERLQRGRLLVQRYPPAIGLRLAEEPLERTKPITSDVSVDGDPLDALDDAFEDGDGNVIGDMFSPVGEGQQGVPGYPTDDVLRRTTIAQVLLIRIRTPWSG